MTTPTDLPTHSVPMSFDNRSGGNASRATVPMGSPMKRLAPIVLVGLGLTGCAQIEALFQASIPPEVQQQLDEQEAALAEYDAAILRVEAQAQEIAQQAKEAVQASDYAKAQALMAELESLQVEHKGMVDLYLSTAEDARESLEGAADATAGGVLSALDPLVPVPLQPLIPAASSLLVMAGSRRSRKHTKRALRHAAVGNLGEGVKDILKAVGAAHSSEGTKKVAEEEEKGERPQQQQAS